MATQISHSQIGWPHGLVQESWRHFVYKQSYKYNQFSVEIYQYFCCHGNKCRSAENWLIGPKPQSVAKYETYLKFEHML